MFKPVFATMNKALDEILQELPMANAVKQGELAEKLRVLRLMSDTCVEEWLLFEEKLSLINGFCAKPAPSPEVSLKELEKSASFIRGQGYFHLRMYKQAIEEFINVVNEEPEWMIARLYLAIGYLHNSDHDEAQRHFQFIIPVTDHPIIKAISYNGLGCIQVRNDNLDNALECFQLAFQTEPTLTDPIINMGIHKLYSLFPEMFGMLKKNALV